VERTIARAAAAWALDRRAGDSRRRFRNAGIVQTRNPMRRFQGVPGLVVGLVVLLLAIGIGVWLTSSGGGNADTPAELEQREEQQKLEEERQEEQQELQEERQEEQQDRSGSG
jgi:hypothetical protein